MSIACLHPRRRLPQLNRRRGVTILELMTALFVLGMLAAVAVPSYTAVVDRQRVGQAVRDLREIALLITKYRMQHDSAPLSLNDPGLGWTPVKDPWGRDYQFLNFDSGVKGINGKIRKDHNLHPLNSDFDLYSLGKDGQSQSPLTAKASRDDVIWARDGGFVGLAEDY
jgi:general secretion pathway protein G